MLHLHCTKKLLTKLPLHDDGTLRRRADIAHGSDPRADNPLDNWHANLMIFQRRQCVLFVHDLTRFPVFISGLKKDDFAELDWFFQDGFMNTLLKAGADDRHMQAAQKWLYPLVCDNDCNRSVQGTLNQMGQLIGFSLEHEQSSIMDKSPYRVGAKLADQPCSAKGVKDYFWPDRAMLELLVPGKSKS